MTSLSSSTIASRAGAADAAAQSASNSVSGLDEATALVFAAERGAARSIQSWMARGGDINGTLVAQAGGCYTPLQLASYTGHAVAVKTLLSCGADPSLTAATVGTNGSSHPQGSAPVGHLPLHLAARYGHSAALEALLEGGVDPNSVDEFSQTALHYAAAFGHLPCVTALTRFGVDVYSAEAGGRTAAELASAASHAQVASYLRRLMEAGGSDSTNDGRAFSVADGSGLGLVGGGTPAGRTAQAALQTQQQFYQQQSTGSMMMKQHQQQQLLGGTNMGGSAGSFGAGGSVGSQGGATGFDYGLGSTAPLQGPASSMTSNPYYGGDANINGNGAGAPGMTTNSGVTAGIDIAGNMASIPIQNVGLTPGRAGGSVGGGGLAAAAANAMSIPALPPPVPQQQQQQQNPIASSLAAAQQQLALASAYGFGGVAPPPLPGMASTMPSFPSFFGASGNPFSGSMTPFTAALGMPGGSPLMATAMMGGAASHQQLLAQLAQMQLQQQLQALNISQTPGQPPSPMQQLLQLQQQQQAIIALSATQQQQLPPLPSIPPARARLRDWLLSIGMSEYYPAFLRQGYDDIDFIFAAGGLSEADCSSLGIQLTGHRRKVSSAYGLKPYTTQGIMERHTAIVQQASAQAAQAQAAQLAVLQQQQQLALAALAQASSGGATNAQKNDEEEEEEEGEEEEEDDDDDDDEDEDEDDDEDGDDDDDDEDDDDEEEDDDDE